MGQLFNQTLNLNVTHQADVVPVNPAGSPDTGFFAGAVDGSALPSVALFAVALILVIASGIFFYFRRKASRQKRANLYRIASVACFALAFGLTIPSVVSVSYANNTNDTAITTDFNAIATKDGNVSITNVDLALDADYPNGYKVVAYMQDGVTNTLSGTAHPESQITATTAAATTADLTMNSYGIKLQDGTYAPVSIDSANPTVLYDTDQAATSGTIAQVTYATKLDKATAEDVYTGKIVLKIEENGPPAGTFERAFWDAGKTKATALDGNKYYQMQDMSDTICSAVDDPTSVTAGDEQAAKLVDIRDQKVYNISKLADGKCWMTQNLDLDITTAGLTNANTDLNSQTAWDSNSTYVPQDTDNRTDTHPSQGIGTETYSWNLGDYYYDGTTVASCGNNATSYANCVGQGFATTGDSHYHVGNLYQWNTATAGTGSGTSASQEAPDSICPKGWRLPTSTSSGEFKNLVDAYSASSSSQTLINSPIYMVRGGFVKDGKLMVAAFHGAYWSSTVANVSNQAYYLLLNGSDGSVNPSGPNSYFYGKNVRCVAR